MNFNNCIPVFMMFLMLVQQIKLSDSQENDNAQEKMIFLTLYQKEANVTKSHIEADCTFAISD